MVVTYSATQGLRFSAISAKNGSTTDVYMRLIVPAKYGWGGIGIGESMDGAMVFVTYPSSDGKSSTLSVRHASTEEEPEPIQSTCHIQQSEANSSMINTAFVCYGLGDYSGLKQQPATSTPWIYALGPEQHIESNSVDASLSYHGTNRKPITLNMNLAQTTMSGPLIAPEPGSHSDIGSSVSEIQVEPSEMLIKAHAALLGLAFLFFFPLGLVLLRLRSVRLHWITQTFAFLLAFCGWVIAIVMCVDSEEYKDFKESHQIIGLISVSLLFPQILLGTFHHRQFRSSGLSSWMRIPHLTIGRIAMTLGLINGILGFLLKRDTTGAIIYGVFAAVVFFSVTALMIWDYVRPKPAKDQDRPLADHEKLPETQTNSPAANKKSNLLKSTLRK